jgi:hypothetical protein
MPLLLHRVSELVTLCKIFKKITCYCRTVPWEVVVLPFYQKRDTRTTNEFEIWLPFAAVCATDLIDLYGQFFRGTTRNEDEQPIR